MITRASVIYRLPLTRCSSQRLLQSTTASQTNNSQFHHEDDKDSLAWIPSVLARLAAALGMIHIVSEYGVQIVLCEGPSMMPTIQPKGEIIFIHKCGLRWGSLEGAERAKQARAKQEAYEATASDYTWHTIMQDNSKSLSIWKQLTSPIDIGDVVVVQHPHKAGTVCKRILGLGGDMIVSPPLHNKNLLIVPDGQMWLEGDNPQNSSDSRDYGPVPASLLVGRVVCRVWPIRRHETMWMSRNGRPNTAMPFVNQHTILPAGYEGEAMSKEK